MQFNPSNGLFALAFILFIHSCVVHNIPTLEPKSSSSLALQTCSRRHSKFVREYFARALLPIYQSFNLPVPDKCPFSPLHDIYHLQENNKTKLDLYKWKCEMCGKVFSSEHFLDKHFDNRHSAMLQKNKRSVCLANHCRIFRCEVLMDFGSGSAKCYEPTISNLRNRCISYLEKCVPSGVSIQARNKLTAALRENLCSYLTCDRYYERPKYLNNGPSFVTVFLIVLCFGICLVTYGVINHTDLIFDENETPEPFDSEVSSGVAEKTILKKPVDRESLANTRLADSNKVRNRVNFDLNERKKNL